MCGIVGYIGDRQAAPVLLDGLSKLEYRGYDSAGLAVFDGTEINMTKAKGRLKVLEERHCRVNWGLDIQDGRLTGNPPIQMHIRI